MVFEKRKERGWSQNRLSKVSGVPQSVISDIEREKTKSPRIDTLKAIASALDTTISELIESKEGG